MKFGLHKCMILCAIFIAVFIYITEGINSSKTIVMSESNTSVLPLVLIKEGKFEYNDLHGYKQEMDLSTGVLPYSIVSSDNVLSFVVDDNENNISDFSYILYDTSNDNIIESNLIKSNNIKRENNKIFVNLLFESIIDEYDNYKLMITIRTKNKGNINYFTRIISEDGANKEMLGFINEFHEATFTKSKEDTVLSNLNNKGRNSKNDNNENGIEKVNLDSSINDIMLDDFDAVKMNTPTIRLINYINNDHRYVYEMNYVLASKNKRNIVYYTVKEQYAVKYNQKQEENKIQLESFERSINSSINVDMVDTETNKLNIGMLSSQDDMNVIKSNNDEYIVLTKGKQVWLYDVKENSIVKIFSFDQLNKDYILDAYNQHGVKVTEVDDEGNITYIVYGYNNNGAYEGYNGVLVKYYEHNTSTNKVLSFIPSDYDYCDLKYDLDYFTYYNDNKMYLAVKGKLYKIDLKNHSYSIMNDKIPINHKDLFVMDGNSSIAWQDSNTDKYNKIINIICFEKNLEYKISATEEEIVKIIGFINDTIVIGRSNVDIVLEQLDGKVILPLEAFEIRDKDNNIVKEYEPPKGKYYIDYSITDNRIDFTTVSVKNTNTNNPINNKIYYSDAKKDLIMYFDETKKEEWYEVERIINEMGYFETFVTVNIAFVDGIPKYSNAKETIVESKLLLSPITKANDVNYTVKNYKNDTLLVSTKLNEAIDIAKKNKINVINKDYKEVWSNKQLPSEYKIKGVPIIKQRPELPRGCEVTSLAMILNYYKVKVDKMKLANEVIKSKEKYVIQDNIVYFGDLRKGFVGDMYNVSNPGIGVYHEPIQALMEKYLDKQVLDLEGVPLEQLLYYISNDKPVWINIANTYNKVLANNILQWKTKDGMVEISYTEHSVVIVGYDNRYIYYNDPSKGKMDYKPIKAFEKAYDSFGRQALVYN